MVECRSSSRRRCRCHFLRHFLRSSDFILVLLQALCWLVMPCGLWRDVVPGSFRIVPPTKNAQLSQLANFDLLAQSYHSRAASLAP